MSPETEDRARAEFYAAKKAARAQRAAFRQSPDAGFVRTMQGAITQYLAARADGVSRDDAVRGLDEELRGAWPKSVSKFNPNCDACADTGWREVLCWDSHRCGRETCAKNPERQHFYVVICDCPKGDRFRKQEANHEDAIARAGRMPKKRTFSRMGQ
jgi:hypothetical protein